MRRPSVQLAKKTIPLLTKFGFFMSSIFIMVWPMCLLLLPLAAASKNLFLVTILSFCPLPLTTIWPIARFGTSCDEYLSELNEMRSERLSVYNEHRVEALRGYLRNLNHEQGLGFVLYGVVLDKKKFAQLGGESTQD